MAERRQLLIEIDRTFKLIAEGLDTFDEKLEAMKAAPNKQQKEKHMAELKEELKKLQRYRAKVMSWSTCKEVKDKRAEFEEQRLIIETRMETYREMERADKTKPFSEKALEAEPKIDPIQRDHEEVFHWLRQTISTLQTQMEPWEADLERLNAEGGGGRSVMAKIDDLRLRIGQNQQHIGKLELIMRYLHNDSIDFEEVKDLRETVEAYIESQRDSNFAVDIDYLDIYEDILATVRENDQLLLLPMTPGQGALNTAVSLEGIDEEPQEVLIPQYRPSSTDPTPLTLHSHRRSTITIPNYAIDDSYLTQNKSSAMKPLHCRNVVVPAPVPPPLSVPYSHVAAAGLQQTIDFDTENESLLQDRDDRALDSCDGSSEKSTSPCNSPSRQTPSPAAVLRTAARALSTKVNSEPMSKFNVDDSTALVNDCRGDSFVKPISPRYFQQPLNGNYSSTDDILALVCDQERLDLFAQHNGVDPPASGDRGVKQCPNGSMDSSSTGRDQEKEDKRASDINDEHGLENGHCSKTSPIGESSCSMDNVSVPLYPVNLPPPPIRLPKLPYAFNGANGGADGEWKFGAKADLLNQLEAASKRLPYPDSSMQSGYRRLWRDNMPQSSFNANYPMQHNHSNFYGVDFNTRFYYTLLTDETLMFVFYYLQGTLAHRYAIECLEERGWMWHVQRMQWFKHETADISALRRQMEMLDQKNGFVAGSFKFFDYDKWEERQASPDFVFHLKYWKTLFSLGNAYPRPMFYMKNDKVVVKEGPF